MSLYLGCTKERHARIGIHAVVNARAGLQKLNDLSTEDIELTRDAGRIKAWVSHRIRFYQFNSKYFRRHIGKVKHLLSNYND